MASSTTPTRAHDTSVLPDDPATVGSRGGVDRSTGVTTGIRAAKASRGAAGATLDSVPVADGAPASRNAHRTCRQVVLARCTTEGPDPCWIRALNDVY